mmetsp:Transcript_51923/g.96019  ORF Transcript_51923/g.96019 Transcript_51923/m.96019 type:complete len:519 (+) Transcript_51923:80-1636(+)
MSTTAAWDKWQAYPPNAYWAYYPVWPVAPEQPDSDSLTVLALAALLRQAGGRRSASAVGHLYNHDCGLHRRVIQASGGVKGFVKAHPDVFALDPPLYGESCPSIRLVQEVSSRREPCRYHRMGLCSRGADCRFYHDPAIEVFASSSQQTGGSCGSNAGEATPSEHDTRISAVREQVKFYLSDSNLRRDAFFHDIISSSEGGWIKVETILSCRRIQQMKVNEEEVLEALKMVDWCELRQRSEDEAPAVRRKEPPPPLQVVPPPAHQVEASLSSSPLELVKHLKPDTEWDEIIMDEARRSFSLIRRSTWSEELLKEEFDQLRKGTAWVVLKNKSGQMTRSTAWYVASGCRCRYSYADTNIDAATAPAWLRRIEDRVLGEGCGLSEQDRPTCVNLNLYLDGNQNVGWHSDDEGLFRGCERDCRIISASWGATRHFELALKDKNHVSGRPSIFRETLKRVELRNGDICTMEGLFQKHYSHQLAKEACEDGGSTPSEGLTARINLTWRYIAEHKPYCPLARRW